MTMNEAIIELKEKGLPFPSPISVLILYDKAGECYKRSAEFSTSFFALVKMQKTIAQENAC